MVKPQEPTLRRTGYGSTSQDGKEIRAGDHPQEAEDHLAPVPEENRPGHHPEVEQDKPEPPTNQAPTDQTPTDQAPTDQAPIDEP